MDRSPEAREAEVVREVVDRALGRLSFFEYVILLVTVLLALGGGALVAWLLGSLLGLSFRWSWAVASLLLFVVPGGAVYLRDLRSPRRRAGTSSPSAGPRASDSNPTEKDLHG